MTVKKVKALAFDVFGTVVDWRSSIIREGTRFEENRTIGPVDWAKFADEWRAGYHPAMDRVRKGTLPWMNIDALHRLILDRLLEDFSITGLNEVEKVDLNRAWHRLEPWPDAVEGLTRLRQRYVIATLSNGNMALLVNMAKHAGLPWDCVFSAELFKHYKPDREVYQGAATLLGLEPSELLMVAAHKNDLRAARGAGCKTAFTPRPFEFGPDNIPDCSPDPEFDWVAKDFLELAEMLGA